MTDARKQIQVLSNYLNSHILGQSMLISRMMIVFCVTAIYSSKVRPDLPKPGR